MIITEDDRKKISKLQEQLSIKFEMKNPGGLKYFLGIKVARSSQDIFLSQKEYVSNLLSEVEMIDCKSVDTSIDQDHKLREHSNQIPANKERYQKLVGKLIYLSHTRLNIAYAISIVSHSYTILVKII